MNDEKIISGLTQLKNTIRRRKPYVVVNVSIDSGTAIKICMNEYTCFNPRGTYKRNLSFNEQITPLNVEDFEQDFKSFTDILDLGTVFVVSDLNFLLESLQRVKSDFFFRDKNSRNKVIEQVNLLQEYISSENAKEETVKKVQSILSSLKDKQKDANSENIRIAEFISAFITENNLVRPNEIIKETLARSWDFDKKADKWISGKLFTPSQVLDRKEKSELNTIFDIIEGKNGYKGFTVLQVVTTGTNFNNQPLQIGLFNFNLQQKKNTSLKIDIAINKFLLESMERNVSNAFDIADIDFNKYKESLKNPLSLANYRDVEKEDKISNNKTYHVYTKEVALIKLKSFFKAYSPKEFPVIMDGIGFSESVLQELSHERINSDSYDNNKLDFSKIIKEYCYLAENDERYKSVPNCLGFKDKKDYCNKDLTLKQIKKNLTGTDDSEETYCGDTLTKCSLIGALIVQIGEQYSEISTYNYVDAVRNERNLSLEKEQDEEDDIAQIPTVSSSESYDNESEELVYRRSEKRSEKSTDSLFDSFNSLDDDVLKKEIDENNFISEQNLFTEEKSTKSQNFQNIIIKLSDNLVEISKANTELTNKYSDLVEKYGELVTKMFSDKQGIL